MNKSKQFTGRIVSAATPNTVIVAVGKELRHPLYRKVVRSTKRFAVHNASLTLAAGDRVTIAQTRPMSRTKHYEVVRKVS